jgi:hypothetical protein
VRLLAPLLLLAALPVVDEPHPLQRVCVLGASMTHGLDFDTGLAEVLEATLVREHDPVLSDANLLFFMDPVGSAEDQLVFARKNDATLIVGVDFLFWFAYGSRNAKDERIRDDSERFARLDQGLALLAEIDVPLVLGDFPDMSDSIGRQLHRMQVPEPETLKRLNARLAAWAKEREQVILIPLASAIDRLRAGEQVTLGRQTWPAGSADLLLSDDRLHPTIEGTIAIANAVVDALVRAELVDSEDVELDLEPVFERLGEPVPEEVAR